MNFVILLTLATLHGVFHIINGAEKCPPGKELMKEYSVITPLKKVFWDAADKECRQNKKILATVQSKKDQEMFENFIKKKGLTDSNFWLGLKIGIGTGANSKRWQWTDGTLLRYSNWKPGEPNSYKHRGVRAEDCAAALGKKYLGKWPDDKLFQWNDLPCREGISDEPPNNFICESRKCVDALEQTTFYDPNGNEDKIANILEQTTPRVSGP